MAELTVPGWTSLLPPLVAIGLALATREVVLSLFTGLWLGAFLLAGYDPVSGTLTSLDYVVNGLSDPDHASIIVFSLLLGGMVGVISRNGGTRGVVDAVKRFATNRKRAQLFTSLSAATLFFDDYAGTLIVGNSMRPLTDRLGVSREKLAYIVDSTAAPLAVLAVVSTWIGFEITQIRNALRQVAEQTVDAGLRAELLAGAENPFNVFLHSVPYLFYPILALSFVLMVTLTGREFGPMLHAERRAATGGGVIRPGAMPAADTSSGAFATKPGTPLRWHNAAVPVIVVILVALVSLYYTGASALAPEERTLRAIIGEANPFSSLLWAAFAGCVVAIALSVAQRILTVTESLEAWVSGLQSMMLAMVILVLAWSLGTVTQDLGTGQFLAGLLSEALPLTALPMLVFLIAAGTSFATGTSWGTMAILFPVVIPLAVAMGAGIGFAGGSDYTILLGTISSVMGGAVFGDHSSPISDTTVMSSMSSSCDHIDHVRTQLPYAVLVAGVAILFGEIPSAFGVPPLVSIVAGIIVLYAVLRLVGQPVEVPETAVAAGDDVGERVLADTARAG